MPTALLQRQAIAQSVYMQFLLHRAEADPSPLAIVDVALDDTALMEVITAIEVTIQQVEPAPLTATRRERLATLLGMTPTLHTLVERRDDRPDNSIISLSREFYFHLLLSSRVYEKLSSSNAVECASAFQSAAIEMNKVIESHYHTALQECTSPTDGLDRVKLNQVLDGLRKELLPKAHTILMTEMARVGVSVPTDTWLKAKHLAETTVATPNDVVCVDRGLGLATLIKGSEKTAHERPEGREFAHRQLVTHSWQKQGNDIVVLPNTNSRVQIRTPSIAVKKGLGESAYVMDVATKLEAISQHYATPADRIPSSAGLPKAFVYNLYTAIHDSIGDRGGNLQTQSAKHIVLGVHQYNARKWPLSDPRFAATKDSLPVLCLLQNISVNGFGQGLRYGSRYPLLQELTLMSELALLHTVYNTVSPEDKTSIQRVMEQYHKFLNTSKRGPYFSNSEYGKSAIADIAKLKAKWATPTIVARSSNDVMDNARNGLRILLANNLHFGHRYTKLVQSLSVFVEPMSVGGCKSGNERAQSINGRVAILDAALSGKPEFTELRQALQKLAVAPNANEAISAADTVKSLLDKAYNEYGLQSAASVVSLIDQGAPAKVEAKKGFHVNRNYAEESQLSRLSQTNASRMQAHKGLVDVMQGSWSGHPKSGWARLKSNIVGRICIVLFPLLIIAWPLAGIRAGIDNANRRRAADGVRAIAIAKGQSNPIWDGKNGSTAHILAGLPPDTTRKVRVAEMRLQATSTKTTPEQSSSLTKDTTPSSPADEPSGPRH